MYHIGTLQEAQHTDVTECYAVNRQICCFDGLKRVRNEQQDQEKQQDQLLASSRCAAIHVGQLYGIMSDCQCRWHSVQQLSTYRTYLFWKRGHTYYGNLHWRRRVKNIGGAIQNIGEKVVNTDKCMGVSQLLGGAPGLPPKFMDIII